MKSTFKVDGTTYDTPVAKKDTPKVIDNYLSHWSQMTLARLYQHMGTKNVKVTNCKEKIKYVEKLIDDKGNDVLSDWIVELCGQGSSANVPSAEEDGGEATQAAATTAPAVPVDVIHHTAVHNHLPSAEIDLLRSISRRQLATQLTVELDCPAKLEKMCSKLTEVDDADDV